MSDLDHDALLKRIEELEMENRTTKKELITLKRNMRSGGCHSLDAASNSHDFMITIKTNMDEDQSISHTINGVEFVINIQKNLPTAINGQSNLHDARFFFSWNIKNTDPTRTKFLLISSEVELAERPSSDQETISPCRSFSHHFLLHGNEEYNSNMQRLAHIHNRRPTWKIKVRLTAVVQTVESPEIDVDNTAVVVVKNKEFCVSVDYLSMWSSYFRAYFRVDMKEKQEGRYPIGDEDIEPEDFQELLDVIHPTSKEISTNNYLLLLRLANRFEMPSLTRRIELFMIDFDRSGIRLDIAFRIASDVYSLKIVQTMILHRWRDAKLMESELLKSEEYDQLSAETKNLVHERFTQACISSKGTNSNRATDQDRRRAVSPTDDTCRRLMALGRDRAAVGGGFGESERRGQDRGGFGRDRDEARGGFGYGAPPDNDGFGGYGGGFDDRD